MARRGGVHVARGARARVRSGGVAAEYGTGGVARLAGSSALRAGVYTICTSIYVNIYSLAISARDLFMTASLRYECSHAGGARAHPPTRAHRRQRTMTPSPAHTSAHHHSCGHIAPISSDQSAFSCTAWSALLPGSGFGRPSGSGIAARGLSCFCHSLSRGQSASPDGAPGCFPRLIRSKRYLSACAGVIRDLDHE